MRGCASHTLPGVRSLYVVHCDLGVCTCWRTRCVEGSLHSSQPNFAHSLNQPIRSSPTSARASRDKWKNSSACSSLVLFSCRFLLNVQPFPLQLSSETVLLATDPETTFAEARLPTLPSQFCAADAKPFRLFESRNSFKVCRTPLPPAVAPCTNRGSTQQNVSGLWNATQTHPGGEHKTTAVVSFTLRVIVVYRNQVHIF